MIQDLSNFKDDSLRQVIRKTAPSPRPELKLKIEGLFDAPQSIPLNPWYTRKSFVASIAAVLLIAITIGLLAINSGNHEEEEYLVNEHDLWPAMAKLHASSASLHADSTDAIAKTIHYPVATLPAGAGELVSSGSGEFLGIPAAALKYKIDGKEMTLITADARKILRETDEVEVYHEKVGTYQLAGGNRGDAWICILADGDVPQAKLDDLLNRAVIASPK